MPLAKSLIRIPLTAGLSDKSDSRSDQPGDASVMTNCVVQKTGAIRKRFGNTAQPKFFNNGSTLASAVAGGSYGVAPWLVGKGAVSIGWSLTETILFSYSPGTQEWSASDVIDEAVALDRMPIITAGYVIADMDQAVGNGLLVIVISATSAAYVGTFLQPYYTILDPKSGAVVQATTPVDATFTTQQNSPKVIVCGTTCVLAYADAVSGQIMARKLDLTNVYAGWGAAVAIVTDGVTTPATGVYDVAPVLGDATRFVVAYEASNGGKKVAIRTITLSTLASAHVEYDDASVTQLVSVAVMGDSTGFMWAAYTGFDGTHSLLREWGWSNASPAIHITPLTLYTFGTGFLFSDTPGRVGIARLDATHAYVCWSPFVDSGTSDYNKLTSSYVQTIGVSSSGTATTAMLTCCALLASKPQVVNGALYVGTQTPSTEQGTFYLCRDDTFGRTGITATVTLRAIATLDPRIGKFVGNIAPNGTSANVNASLALMPSIGNTVLSMLAYTSTSPVHASVFAYPVELAPTSCYSSAEVYGIAALAAGVPSAFDGQNVSELGFTAYPTIIAGTSPTVGAMVAGVYSYVACYEWLDAHGQIHRSAPSTPATFTATATSSAVVVVAILPFTQRTQMGVNTGGTSLLPPKALPYVVIYRTQANGTIFYRVTSDPPPATAAASRGAPIVNIADGASDASIALNATLYTTGGQLGNVNPPSARICVSHRNRWWLAGCPDPTAIWPTKEVTPGEGPGFNEALDFTATGAVRALASMDDKLLVFVQRGASFGLEFITGEGPTDQGTQSDWTPPQRVPTDVGATDQRGVCVGPFGCLFRAPVGGPTGAGGIFLLTRDLQHQYISGAVEDLLAANPVVTSMVVHPNQGRVYITCVPSETGYASGVRLVWDYQSGGVWSSDTLTDPDTAQTSCGVPTAWVAQGPLGVAYYWATSAGRVYTETRGGTVAGAYLDAGAWVPMTYQSAFIKPEEAGFARFWRVLFEADCLEPSGPSDFVLVLTFDGAPASYYNEPRTITGAAVATYDRFPIVDLELPVGNQKAKSIQITYTESASDTGSVGAGYSIGGIVIEAGVKEGGFRNFPAAQRV